MAALVGRSGFDLTHRLLQRRQGRLHLRLSVVGSNGLGGCNCGLGCGDEAQLPKERQIANIEQALVVVFMVLLRAWWLGRPCARVSGPALRRQAR